jgi:hypothetical protein
MQGIELDVEPDGVGELRCSSGLTQIERVLKHAASEATRRLVGAVVFVGDACEEPMHRLLPHGAKLAELKVPLFMFQEGRDYDATRAFAELATLTKGAHLPFDSGSGRQLGELLRAVAAFTMGGIKALENQGSNSARLLLGQMRK